MVGPTEPRSGVADMAENGGFAGAPEWNRTTGLRFRKPVPHSRARLKTAVLRGFITDDYRPFGSETDPRGARCTKEQGL